MGFDPLGVTAFLIKEGDGVNDINQAVEMLIPGGP
jgi:hypothetical protein